MNLVERKTTYFIEAGNQNTDALLKLAKEYAEKEDIRDIVVASTTEKLEQKHPKSSKDTTSS